MKFLIALISILVIMSGCSNNKVSYYGNLITDIGTYQLNCESPEDIENIETSNEWLDINYYFEICKHISLMEGWKVDYFYYKNFLAGYPILYSYEENNNPVIDYNDYYNTEQEKLITKKVPDFVLENDFLDNIELDGSEDSYIEYAVLDTIGAQFLLYWHSCYNDNQIIESQYQLNQILKKLKNANKKFKRQAKQLNIEPEFTYNENELKLSILCFSNWTGFYYKNYYFNTEDKNLVSQEKEIVLEYDCGIMF